MDISRDWHNLPLTADVKELLGKARSLWFPQDREELFNAAKGGKDNLLPYDVVYDVPGKGPTREATVTPCRNGVAVNYSEPYMRRRDPDCMVIGDRSQRTSARTSAVSAAVRASAAGDVPLADGTGSGGVGLHSRRSGPAQRSRGAVDRARRMPVFSWRPWRTCRKCCRRRRCPTIFSCGRSCTLLLPFGTRISTASRWSCTTARNPCTRCFPTTSIRGRAQRKASTACCCPSARMKSG